MTQEQCHKQTSKTTPKICAKTKVHLERNEIKVQRILLLEKDNFRITLQHRKSYNMFNLVFAILHKPVGTVRYTAEENEELLYIESTSRKDIAIHCL